jgi:hypothetical protein
VSDCPNCWPGITHGAVCEVEISQAPRTADGSAALALALVPTHQGDRSVHQRPTQCFLLGVQGSGNNGAGEYAAHRPIVAQGCIRQQSFGGQSRRPPRITGTSVH